LRSSANLAISLAPDACGNAPFADLVLLKSPEMRGVL